MPKRLTTQTFNQQLSIEHPELELLSEYNGNKNYVTVRCKIHDYVFNTKPNWLHKGNGCQKCYDDRRGDKTRKSIDEFLSEARKIHGNKYDYSNVVYERNNKKVCIICPEHGEFWQTPNKHLLGQGCPICAGKIKITNNLFIEKAKKVHGDKYDYSKVEYVNNHTKVCIVCPEHGEFWQTPDKHTNAKQGCPICKNSKLVMTVIEFLKRKNISFELEKQFEWLGRQKIDIFLPKQKIAIECQGLQHFISLPHFGGKEGLEKNIRRDVTKYNLCEENSIKLLYFVEERDFKKIKQHKFLNIYTLENTFPLSVNTNTEMKNTILEQLLND